MEDGSILRDLCRHVAYVSIFFLAGIVLSAPGYGVAGEKPEKEHVIIFVLENKGFGTLSGILTPPFSTVWRYDMSC